jgi:hypothetical protein
MVGKWREWPCICIGSLRVSISPEPDIESGGIEFNYMLEAGEWHELSSGTMMNMSWHMFCLACKVRRVVPAQGGVRAGSTHPEGSSAFKCPWIAFKHAFSSVCHVRCSA